MSLLVTLLTAAANADAAACSVHPIDAMFKVGMPDGGLLAHLPLARPLAAARGELIHLQAHLIPTTAAKTATVDAVVDGLGAATVRALVYTQLNVTLRTGSAPGLYPDALAPSADPHRPSTFELAADAASACAGGSPCVFWLSLRVPPTAAPGLHRGAINVTLRGGGVDSAGTLCGTSFEVQLSKFTLPTTPTQLTNTMFAQHAVSPFSPSHTVSLQTSLQWFKALAAQRVNTFVWFELDELPWAPTARFNAERTAVTLNTSLHEVWWPKVLALSGSQHWRLPFSTRGHVKHFLPTNATHEFHDASGHPFNVPMFKPGQSGVLDAEFERLFRILFGASVAYLDRHGWAINGTWVFPIDEAVWSDNVTLDNTLALMTLYKSVDPRIKIYSTRFPVGPPTPSGWNPPAFKRLIESVDWWVAHVCQWVAPGVSEYLASLRKARQLAHVEFHASVYDNGVPIIEAPWERVRTQPLDVFNSNGTLSGTLSWYSIDDYGTNIDPATNKTIRDPWLNPMPSPLPRPDPATGKFYDHPAGKGYLLWPPPPGRRQAEDWAPLDSVRWVMTGAGLQDAEYLHALRSKAAGSAAAAALIAKARSFATQFPYLWKSASCTADPAQRSSQSRPRSWDDDGYSVDAGGEKDGSSAVNEWRLAMGGELDKVL